MAYVNDTGYPSVTQVLMPYVNTDWFTEEHSKRGQVVHGAVASYFLGLWVPPLRPDYQPYFDSARRWIDDRVAEVILVEERLVDPTTGYCGQPDLIARLKGEASLTLIDWKTSQAWYLWWKLQAAGYRWLARVDRGIKTARGMSVRLKKDGKGVLIGKGDYGCQYTEDLKTLHGIVRSYQFFNKGAA